ncbi:MAG: HDIG domain-containing protein [Eubacteriales bacterium]|nr:HDIG domain-containing protein [Eubacteriales bacterium]
MKKTIKVNRQKALDQFGILFKVLITVILSAIIFFSLMIRISSDKYEIKVGEVASETIKATKDIVDRITTEELRSQARASVSEVYILDKTIVGSVKTAIAGYTDTIRSLAKYAKTFKQAGNTYDEKFFREQREELGLQASDDVLVYIFDTLDLEKELPAVISQISANVEKEMNAAIMDKDLEEAKSGIFLAVQINLLNVTSSEMIELARLIINKTVRADFLLDQNATEAARQAAADEVADVKYIKGQIIITEGQVVTPTQFEVVKELGLVKGTASDAWLKGGFAAFSLVIGAIMFLYLFTCEKALFASMKKFAIIMAVTAISFIVDVLISYVSIWLMPVVYAALILTMVANMKTANVVNVLLSAGAGIIAYFASDEIVAAALIITISYIVCGGFTSYLMKNSLQRYKILFAGLVGAAAALIVTAALTLIFTSSLEGSWMRLLLMMGAVMLAAVLAIGTLPIWELLFKIYTPIRLLELANHNNVLLQKLLREAPGSYHHSLLVANIAESCAEAVGADVLLTRVGAYFHDVGKVRAPRFFKENQVGENPHDKLTPEASAKVITSHTVEGAALAKKNGLPEAIQRIILEHHGTMPALYFYQQAKMLYGEETVNLEDYQYAGPTPSSKESAIIMLADASEAAVRAATDHGDENIREIIRGIIEKRKELKQFDNCDLSFKDLRVIEDVLVNTMNRLYHERIEYPPEISPAASIEEKEKE